jgi:hypothetical protein
MPRSIHRKLYCHGVPLRSIASLKRIIAIIDSGGRNPDPESERCALPSLSIDLRSSLTEQVNHLYAAAGFSGRILADTGGPGHL